MAFLIWLVLLTSALLTLAYRRTDLKTSTVVLGALLVLYWLFGDGSVLWNALLLVAFLAVAILNIESVRRDNVTRRLLGIYRRMLPSMSKTEQEALEAGSVWWDGELFTGMPDWRRLKNLPPPKLTPEERVPRRPTEELCRLLGDRRSRTSSPTCRGKCGSSSRRTNSSR
jgi:acyl-CoA dehydrogenase